MNEMSRSFVGPLTTQMGEPGERMAAVMANKGVLSPLSHRDIADMLRTWPYSDGRYQVDRFVAHSGGWRAVAHECFRGKILAETHFGMASGRGALLAARIGDKHGLGKVAADPKNGAAAQALEIGLCGAI